MPNTQQDADSPQIVVIDQSAEYLNMLKNDFSHEFVIITFTDPQEALYYIQKTTNIGIVITEYTIPKINSIELLTRIRLIDPKIQRMMMVHNLTSSIAIECINIAQVHMIIQKPWISEEFGQGIRKLYSEHKRQKNDQSKIKREKVKNDLHQRTSTEDVMSLLLSLSETHSENDFSDLLLEAINGLRSLAIIHFEIFLETQDNVNFITALDYLTDIEVMSTHYNQKVVSMYINITRAYMYLITKDLKNSNLFYNGALAYYEWFQEKNIDQSLRDAITDFPINVYDGGLDLNRDHIVFSNEMRIRQILKIKVHELVNISDSLFKITQGKKSDVFYLIIVRDEIPVYEKKRQGSDLDVSLITGFVVALSNFLTEVVSGSGKIETISHSTGVVMIHNYNEFSFVIFTLVNDITHKIALRHFAIEVYDLLFQIPPNALSSREEEVILDAGVDKYFGKFL